MEIKTVHVEFYGVLAEVTGTRLQEFTEVSDLRSLVQKVTDLYPDLKNYNYTTAVANRIQTANIKLTDREKVAFMPPFSGG